MRQVASMESIGDASGSLDTYKQQVRPSLSLYMLREPRVAHPRARPSKS